MQNAKYNSPFEELVPRSFSRAGGIGDVIESITALYDFYFSDDFPLDLFRYSYTST
jgi:hypothetical protein